VFNRFIGKYRIQLTQYCDRRMTEFSVAGSKYASCAVCCENLAVFYDYFYQHKLNQTDM